jgi:hypothetical protein
MRRLLIPALLVFASCGNSNNNNGGDDGSVNNGPDLATNNVTTHLSIGPIPLTAGQERTICSTFKLPTTTEVNVVQIDSTLAPGSHHLILYKSMATTEKKDIYDCQPLDISGGDIPVYIAETESDNLLPLPTGVAYKFPAGQMIRLEAHYLNATTSDIMGMGDVRLVQGDTDESKYMAADIMFCGSVSALTKGFGMGVPPGATTLPPGFYKPPAGIKVFGATTHEHKRGSGMTLAKSTGTNDPGMVLSTGMPYDNPPFVVYNDSNLLSFAPGEGFRWQCSYQNNSQMTYYFGQSAQDNEMCFFWAYYYPSVGHFINPQSDLGTCGQ